MSYLSCYSQYYVVSYVKLIIVYSLKQAEENRIRKEDDIRLKREEECKKDEEKLRKKEEEKARREAILQQFKLKKEMENNDDVRTQALLENRTRNTETTFENQTFQSSVFKW